MGISIKNNWTLCISGHFTKLVPQGKKEKGENLFVEK
jgi:hypothetical protein